MALSVTPDAELVGRVLQGDHAAIVDLVARLTPVFQREAARFLFTQRAGASPHRVEDLVQELFLGLWKEDWSPLRTWIPEAGRSLASYLRHWANWRLRPKAAGGAWAREVKPEDAVSPSAEEPVLWTQFLEQLEAELMQALSPLGQEMYHLLFVEQSPVEEICARKGMKPEAVHQWRSKLRRLVLERARSLGAAWESPRASAPRVSRPAPLEAEEKITEADQERDASPSTTRQRARA